METRYPASDQAELVHLLAEEHVQACKNIQSLWVLGSELGTGQFQHTLVASASYKASTDPRQGETDSMPSVRWGSSHRAKVKIFTAIHYDYTSCIPNQTHVFQQSQFYLHKIFYYFNNLIGKNVLIEIALLYVKFLRIKDEKKPFQCELLWWI